jgi:mannose-1-phosphate guanylyltransferase
VLDLIQSGRAVSVEYEVFPRLVGAGLYARSFEGYWRDIGTPQSYLGANLERMPPEGLVDPTARVDPAASVRASVVGPGCRIEAGAHVSDSVLLAGAVVAEGRTVDNQVVGTTGEPVW